MPRKYTKRKPKEPATPPITGMEDPKSNRWSHTDFYLRTRFVEKKIEEHDTTGRARAAKAGEEYVDGPQTRLCWDDVLPDLQAEFKGVPDDVQRLRMAEAIRQASGLVIEGDCRGRRHFPVPVPAPAPAPAPASVADPVPAPASVPAPPPDGKFALLCEFVDRLQKSAAVPAPPPPEPGPRPRVAASSPDMATLLSLVRAGDEERRKDREAFDKAMAALGGLESRLGDMEARPRVPPPPKPALLYSAAYVAKPATRPRVPPKTAMNRTEGAN